MSMGGWEEPWKSAEAALGRAEQLLMAPSTQACEATAVQLEAVEGALRAALSSSTAARPEPGQVQRLRGGLRRVTLLLDNAAAFRLGWARVLAAMVGGYTERGEPKPLQPPASIELEG